MFTDEKCTCPPLRSPKGTSAVGMYIFLGDGRADSDDFLQRKWSTHIQNRENVTFSRQISFKKSQKVNFLGEIWRHYEKGLAPLIKVLGEQGG